MFVYIHLVEIRVTRCILVEVWTCHCSVQEMTKDDSACQAMLIALVEASFTACEHVE